MVVVVVEKERKGDLVWVEEEERKRVLVFNALTDIYVTVYLSSVKQKYITISLNIC